MTDKPEKIDLDDVQKFVAGASRYACSHGGRVLPEAIGYIEMLLAEVERLESQLAEARNDAFEQAAERVGMWRRHVRERFPKEYMTVRPCLEAIAAELCGMKEKP